MKLKVPDAILSIAPYVPGKPITALARELGVRHAIKLASNENPIGPSPLALKALQGILSELNRYPDGGGYELVGKLSEKFAVSPEQIVLGAGSDDIIAMLTRALLMPGDEAVMPKPSFLMYDIMVRSASARSVRVPLKSLAIDLDEMAARVNDKTRMIFLTNPNNPTGTSISKDDFERFLNSVPAEVVVIVDEAYIEFVRDPACMKSIRYIQNDRAVVVLRTFSKAYGLAGLRVGYGLMPEAIAALLHRVRQPFNVNSLSQAAAAAALEDNGFLEKTLEVVHAGLDFIDRSLADMQIRHFPTQANFLLVDVETDADEVYAVLLRKGVIVRSMRSYGYPQYIRVSAGLPEENERFVEALGEVLRP
ncbi:MAG: histidinol-phosphate transaminase [Deltaproteobacteria bacterium]|nr:histidinol-phosphate transaminase [Deltaproteobacteria bacterium]